MTANPTAARLRARLPRLFAALFSLSALPAANAHACACGCSIFNVTGAQGGMANFADTPYSVFFRYGYINQNKNLAGSSPISADLNKDQQVNTSFYIFGASWRFDPDWSVETEVPLFARHLTTTDDGSVNGPAGSQYTGKLTDVGDVSAVVTYTGFADNYTTGVSAGLKLPTGNDTGPNGVLGGAEFDADTRPGSGSTDLILGGYHNGRLSEDGVFGYYTQARAQVAIATQNAYRPGNEFDLAAGVSYGDEDLFSFARITPVVSVIGSYRQRDTGDNADTANTGYERVFIAPGLELRFHSVRVFGDVEVPVYQRVNAGTPGVDDSVGQLVSGPIFKLQVNYDF